MSEAGEVRIVPYLLLGDTRRQALEAMAIDCLARWRRQWVGPDAQPATVRIEADCTRLQQSQASYTQVLRATAAGYPAIDIVSAPDVLPAIVGIAKTHASSLGLTPAEPGSLGGSLQLEMLTALSADLLDAARIKNFEIAPSFSNSSDAFREAVRHRHVAVSVHLGAAAAAFVLLFAPGFIEAISPVRQKAQGEPTPVEPLHALQEEVTQIEAFLGETEITFGELASLSPGDVIVLGDGPLQPIQVRIRDGEGFAHGELGSMKEKRAVRISNVLSAQSGAGGR